MANGLMEYANQANNAPQYTQQSLTPEQQRLMQEERAKTAGEGYSLPQLQEQKLRQRIGELEAKKNIQAGREALANQRADSQLDLAGDELALRQESQTNSEQDFKDRMAFAKEGVDYATQQAYDELKFAKKQSEIASYLGAANIFTRALDSKAAYDEAKRRARTQEEFLRLDQKSFYAGTYAPDPATIHMQDAIDKYFPINKSTDIQRPDPSIGLSDMFNPTTKPKSNKYMDSGALDIL